MINGTVIDRQNTRTVLKKIRIQWRITINN
jgi:hypothetical protein